MCHGTPAPTWARPASNYEVRLTQLQRCQSRKQDLGLPCKIVLPLLRRKPTSRTPAEHNDKPITGHKITSFHSCAVYAQGLSLA